MNGRGHSLLARAGDRLWRWAIHAAHWLNGSAHARPVEPLSRCAYDQMMVVMTK